MKKSLLLILALALLLCACQSKKAKSQPEQSTASAPSESRTTEPSDVTPPVSDVAPTQTDTPSEATEPPVPETTAPPKLVQPADGKLVVARTGRFSGVDPENGADEDVTDVAALLIVNTSDQVCQYCTLSYTVDGKAAVFLLSELPAGKAAWVLESSGLTVGEDAKFTYEDDVSIFREADAAWLDGVSVEGDNGSITVTNTSGADYPLVTVYYKLIREDDTFLGGIAYRITVNDLKAGESRTLPAGHYYKDACQVVGIYADGM